MTRKRTPDQDQAETTTAVAEQPATASATAEPAAQEGNGPTFAERVGQKSFKPTPDPFGIATDYQAGVRLFESKQDRQMVIKFGEGRPEDKPSQAVIDTMKEAGYRWNPSEKIWAHPVRFESAMTTRIEAERLYEQVRQMIREEKGIEAGPAIPF